MTADIAKSFNYKAGQEVFVIPQASIDEEVKLIPGTDGEKMSKSRNNFINLFLPEKELKKVIGGIVTDSTPLEAPKNPDTCNAFAIYKVIASKSQTEEMRQNYVKGGYGYGHAKNAIFELILEKYKEERAEYTRLMANEQELENALRIGEAKAAERANAKLAQVRAVVGFS